LGNLSTPKTVQKLQKALHAKAKAEAGHRFYALYDKISRDEILAHAYAALISRDFSMRARYLEEIASLHTRRDLLSQVKIGPKTVADIEEWHASKGRRLRRSDEDLSAVICSFKVKRHAPSDEGSYCLSRGNGASQIPDHPAAAPVRLCTVGKI
jgi:hypothetical protein